MSVKYHQRKGKLTPNYNCHGPHSNRIKKSHCQSISGYSLDKAIGELPVEAMTPLALEVALNVQREIQVRWEEADRLRRLEVDRVRYEAELSRRRFLRVDPGFTTQWAAAGYRVRSAGGNHWRARCR